MAKYHRCFKDEKNNINCRNPNETREMPFKSGLVGTQNTFRSYFNSSELPKTNRSGIPIFTKDY